MKKIYKELKERNLNLIKNNGIKYDSMLKYKDDPRKCLAIFSQINDIKHTCDLKYLYSDLEKIGKNCIYYINNSDYDRGYLHFTLLQLVGFDYIDNIIIDDLTIFDKIIPIVRELLPLKIKYKGIAIIPTGIILCGYPDKEVNLIRDKIRKILKHFIREPYYNNIVHSTICRFTEKLDINLLNSLKEKYENTFFGTIKIESFDIGYGTWKLNNYEIKTLCKIK
jgi:hypothetical protein